MPGRLSDFRVCGIASIFAYDSSAPPVDRDELVRIRDRMVARGPDGFGEWISPDGRVGLAHRRLAIIDTTEAGAQPMTLGDGGLSISFNGEIYNHRELRASLESRGFRFRSSSDTEVLLHLYADRGVDMLNDLRGMYAFALWNARDRSMLLARDPFGIKPLYYADDGKTLRVASQVKALLAGGGVDTAPDPAGHAGYFLWGHVPEPCTLYRGIRMLPAGSFMRVRQVSGSESSPAREPRVFCSIPDEIRKASSSPVDLPDGARREYIRETLIDSVRHHLVSDVPVGVFLSAGIDSTTLASLASEIASEPLHSVTLGFREYLGTGQDEAPLAEEVAALLGTRHNTVRVDRADFASEFERMLDAMDQPTTDGVNSYFVSKAAAGAGFKVALSGLGGDEIFGGYPSFRQVPRLHRAMRPLSAIPGLGRGFRAISASLLRRFTSPKYAGLLEYGGNYGGAYLLRRGMFMPWELPDLLGPEMAREGWRQLQTMTRLGETTDGIAGDHLKIAALEMCWYMRNQLLRDTDWAGMAHSLEIRVPLIDLPSLRRLAPLFAGGEHPSRRDMAATLAQPLPAGVLDRQKSGFSIPVRDWFGGGAERGLRGWARQLYWHWEHAR